MYPIDIWSTNEEWTIDCTGSNIVTSCETLKFHLANSMNGKRWTLKQYGNKNTYASARALARSRAQIKRAMRQMSKVEQMRKPCISRWKSGVLRKMLYVFALEFICMHILPILLPWHSSITNRHNTHTRAHASDCTAIIYQKQIFVLYVRHQRDINNSFSFSEPLAHLQR